MMTPLAAHLESLLNVAERKALVAVLRARPDLTLEKLQDCFGGRYGATLRTITVRELIESDTPQAGLASRSRAGSGLSLAPDAALDLALDLALHRGLPPDGGPPINHRLLEHAKRVSGEEYDALVLDVILGAKGRPVSASYLRARVGGPRWKLQGSLKRLVDAGSVQRKGVTSSTRYRPAEPNLALGNQTINQQPNPHHLSAPSAAS
jgi:hypothetical protein